MKVAIDGPAGSGKSTVAKALAERLGFTMLDTGAMYRAVTLACVKAGVNREDDEAVARVAREVRIEFSADEAGTQRVLLDGGDVTADIRTPKVDKEVSRVSAIPAVRDAMVEEQRRMAASVDVVAEGRDIGTVVFPDAEVKVFLTADAAARAHRRAQQRNIDDPAREQEILEDLMRRDEADSSRKAAPLKAADDAYPMDNSTMTVEEEVCKIMELVEKARASAEGGKPVEEGGKPAEELPAEGPEDARKSAEEGEKPAEELPAEGPEDARKPARRGLFGRFAKGRRKPAGDKDEPTGKDKDEPTDGPMAPFSRHEPEEYHEHPIREFPVTSRALLGAAVYVCGASSKVVWPWKIEGGEKLWKAESGRVVVMNHVSMIDPVLVAVSLWMHGRRMRPIYKSELDNHKLMNWLLARVGGIPVERGTADIKAVRRAQRALQRGEDVLVFPEGTRVHSDDQEVKIHGGFALMAQLAKVPVLPVAIVGARDGAPGGNGPLRPGRIWMSVGEPITFDQIEEKGRKKRAKAMEKLAMERVYALRDELRAEHPGKM